ncbi:unnamed protein product, partial [Mycena citricolor]
MAARSICSERVVQNDRRRSFSLSSHCAANTQFSSQSLQFHRIFHKSFLVVLISPLHYIGVAATKGRITS